MNIHLYVYTYIYTNTHAHFLTLLFALCTMNMIDPCHTLRNPTNTVDEIGLPRFQTEWWAIPILCMPVHEHHHGYWMRQMNISNTISKDCNPIFQIVPLHWHYIDRNIYFYTHLVVIVIAYNGVPKAMRSYKPEMTNLRFLVGVCAVCMLAWCNTCLLITKRPKAPSHYRYLIWVLYYIP